MTKTVRRLSVSFAVGLGFVLGIYWYRQRTVLDPSKWENLAWTPADLQQRNLRLVDWGKYEELSFGSDLGCTVTIGSRLYGSRTSVAAKAMIKNGKLIIFVWVEPNIELSLLRRLGDEFVVRDREGRILEYRII